MVREDARVEHVRSDARGAVADDELVAARELEELAEQLRTPRCVERPHRDRARARGEDVHTAGPRDDAVRQRDPARERVLDRVFRRDTQQHVEIREAEVEVDEEDAMPALRELHRGVRGEQRLADAAFAAAEEHERRSARGALRQRLRVRTIDDDGHESLPRKKRSAHASGPERCRCNATSGPLDRNATPRPVASTCSSTTAGSRVSSSFVTTTPSGASGA